MKTKLTKTEIDELLPAIKRVLQTGEAWESEILHYPAGAIIAAVLSIKGMTKKTTDDNDEGFETNGWQYDWWQHFAYNGKKYTLSGSGYCGGHSFYIADE